jgi:hypothetical protein
MAELTSHSIGAVPVLPEAIALFVFILVIAHYSHQFLPPMGKPALVQVGA